MKEKNTALTPMLKQYFDIKAQYPGAILLYRVGDFYETYGEDAVVASRVLGLVLTRKSSGNGTFIEMAGVPYHAIDNYLPRLVQAGLKAAICDQLEDPRLTKKLVKRGVTELVTPGVAYHDNLLCAGENNWLAACAFAGKSAGLALLDISTGTFKVAQGSDEYIEMLLGTLTPKEVLVEKSFADGFRQRYGTQACITPLDPWAFVPEAAWKKVCGQLGVSSLKGFGVEGLPLGVAAAGAVLFYLEMTQHTALGHIRSLARLDEGAYVWMDRFTLRNLEVFEPLAGAEGRSLLQAVNRCCSPMGTRRLREWLALPLKD
ncbi:MAG: DNA mismatch repair protein MutS, partial [Bacteroidales bacterium]|nr:DNA mismatch repair protein MutS [Bacteroidales bacterium]